uniref:Ras-GAP domain-containing protein n=1 Tax=Haemonchus contortus TaxID=6289 RepID=A0A7I4XS47_HAECO
MRPQGNYIIHHAETPSIVGAIKEDKEGLEDDRDSYSTTLEHFLGTLCDLQRSATATRLGLRYPKTREVTELLMKIERCHFTGRDLIQSHPNIILSEMLMSLPPLFENEEFLSLSQSAGQDLVVRYLVSSIDALSLASRQRAYLLCSSLRNILQFTSQRGQSLTDVLMLFTPMLFPRCATTTDGFLRASRALLIMIERSHLIFEKEYISQTEESFLRDLLNSIDGLQNGVCEEDDPPDSDTKLIDDETSFEHLQFTDSQFYYILAYSD